MQSETKEDEGETSNTNEIKDSPENYFDDPSWDWDIHSDTYRDPNEDEMDEEECNLQKEANEEVITLPQQVQGSNLGDILQEALDKQRKSKEDS